MDCHASTQCCIQELQERITFMQHNIKAIVQPQSNTTIKYTKGGKRRFLVMGTLRFLAWWASVYSSRQARGGQNCQHHCETELILETSTICWTTSNERENALQGSLYLGGRCPSMPIENNHVDASNNRLDEGKTEAQEGICQSHTYMLWKR
jgi:hypothetical protein